MPSASNFAGFLVLALVIIIVPGPSVIFAIGRALILGTKQALISVFANALGVGIQIVVVAFGLGALIQGLPQLLLVIKVLGALFIAFLGTKAILDRDQFRIDGVEKSSSQIVAAQSVLVGLTNAKTFVFFLAALPTFVAVSDGNLSLQMLTLGAAFLFIGVASDSVYAIVAGKARRWLAGSNQRLSAVRAFGGVALVLLGGYLLFETF